MSFCFPQEKNVSIIKGLIVTWQWIMRGRIFDFIYFLNIILIIFFIKGTDPCMEILQAVFEK